jgi:hypothetical protein
MATENLQQLVVAINGWFGSGYGERVAGNHLAFK